MEVVGRRDTAEGILGSGAIDAVQLIPVGIGRRAQHVVIEYAEHRRVGTDAKSERDDSNEGEAGRATQQLDGEADVTENWKPGAHESPSMRPTVRPPMRCLVHQPEVSFMAFSSSRR